MKSAPDKVRVLIIDDSAAVRQALSSIIQAAPDLEVMATAGDPFVAAKRIQEEVPDVILLDIEMPRIMDGLTFLRKDMAQRPIPCVLCSTLAESGSDVYLDALEAGAVDVIQKPRVDTRKFFLESQARICDALRAAARASLRARPIAPAAPSKKLSADVIMPPPSRLGSLTRTTEQVVCIGASTGGTESLREVLTALPADSPGIVIVQHMPEHFTAAFAKRLDGLCAIDVKEAADRDPVLPGRALIAPGNRHMLLQRSGARYHVAIKDGPPVSRHRPSVDVLFRSAAQFAGVNAIGIIMTGMGDDGARGLLEMKNAGAVTIAQNEETCVVFGMPKEAIALGAADKTVPISAIPSEILNARAKS
ncbi:MAG: protein-glutamate methylesterase/protein-glutamine glutaminase [Roseiarcus sp.]